MPPADSSSSNWMLISEAGGRKSADLWSLLGLECTAVLPSGCSDFISQPQRRWSGPAAAAAVAVVHMYEFTSRPIRSSGVINTFTHVGTGLTDPEDDFMVAGNGCQSGIGSVYGASGRHQRFRSAVSIMPLPPPSPPGDPAADSSNHGDEDTTRVDLLELTTVKWSWSM